METSGWGDPTGRPGRGFRSRPSRQLRRYASAPAEGGFPSGPARLPALAEERKPQALVGTRRRGLNLARSDTGKVFRFRAHGRMINRHPEREHG